MTDRLEKVRETLSNIEDVSLPDDMVAPLPVEENHPDADPFAGMEPDFTPDGEPSGGDGDKLRLASTYPINDLGNSQRLVLHFGEDLIFVPRVGWHVWDGRVWQADPDMIASRRKAQRLSELVLAEVPYLTLSAASQKIVAEEDDLLAQEKAMLPAKDENGNLPDEPPGLGPVRSQLKVIKGLKESLSRIRTAHRTFARSTGNTAKIKAAMTEAEVPLSVRIDDLNTAHLDVNTHTCVLRLEVTPRPGTYPVVNVTALPHDRALHMTKIMTTGYDPEARAPIFQRFLNRIMPDPIMQAFLQRWFGYSMLGLTNEQALAFFYGMGANGKSALTDLMARLMGSYAATAKIESLTGQNRRSAGDATPDLVNIVSARMVRASEPEKGVRWQEGLIKQLTGGEPILVRALQKDFLEVTPIFKLTIGGNHAPDIRGMDDGIWRRLMIVPFDVQIPKDERDPMIVQRMLEEGPGILNWLVEGALAYLEGGLAPPKQVSQATDSLRKDADPYGKFLDEFCVVTGDPRDSITSRELMLAFSFWQMQRGETPYKERTISLNMKDHSRRWRSPSTGRQFVARETGHFNGYDGLRLSDLFKRDWDAAPKDNTGRAISMGQNGGQDRFGDDEF